MEKKDSILTGITDFSSKVLKECSGALVAIFDGVFLAKDKVGEVIKKTPDLSKSAKEIVSKKLENFKPVKKIKQSSQNKAEVRKLSLKIKKRKQKIESLYYEIGKQSSKFEEGDKALDSQVIKKLVSDIRDYEAEISKIEDQMKELETKKETKVKKKPAVKPQKKIKKLIEKVKPAPTRTQISQKKLLNAKTAKLSFEKKVKQIKLTDKIKNVIKVQIKTEKFDSLSERAKFEKIANDLLDNDVEIKILAASELAKMKYPATVAVLTEALEFNDPYLNSEILNALINIGDRRAVPAFVRFVNDKHHRVRIACLRGLYKLSENKTSIDYLLDALKDEHPEVRKIALLLIGWIDNEEIFPDYSVASVVQCLNDNDERVRKASISTLANIRDKAAVLPLINLLSDNNLEIRKSVLNSLEMIIGESIEFDVSKVGIEQTEAIDELKRWWHNKKLGRLDIVQPDKDQEDEIDIEIDVIKEDDESESDDLKEDKDDLSETEDIDSDQSIEDEKTEDIQKDDIETIETVEKDDDDDEENDDDKSEDSEDNEDQDVDDSETEDEIDNQEDDQDNNNNDDDDAQDINQNSDTDKDVDDDDDTKIDDDDDDDKDEEKKDDITKD